MMTNHELRKAMLAHEELDLDPAWMREEREALLRPEPVWLVESRTDDTPWVLDDSQGDRSESEFVDEVDAMAFAGLIAGLDNHDATLVRVRHRYETEATVTISVTIVRHMKRLFRDLGIDA